MVLKERLTRYTAQLEQKGLLRKRLVSNPKESQSLYFDSNDYLSLTQDKRISKAYEHGYKLYPSGSGASMLLSGYHSNHQALERRFAEFLAVDECVLFSSGYAANLAVMSLLGRVQAHCIIDKNIHASVYDGLTLSQADYSRYLHNSLTDLSRKLVAQPACSVVITEGIYSMSGQMSPLSEVAALCKQTENELIVDEAHSFGVLGSQGKGAVDVHQLAQKDVCLRVIPFGKAFAAQGALVAGQKEWIDALLQAGRSLIYSTSISPALSYGLLKTLDVVINAEDRRHKLMQLVELFKQKIKTSSLDWSESNTAIQQLRLGCSYKALRFAQQLKSKGIYCSLIRPPTVNKKSTGLRIILNYHHQPEHIHQLFNELHSIDKHTPS